MNQYVLIFTVVTILYLPPTFAAVSTYCTKPSFLGGTHNQLLDVLRDAFVRW